MHRLHYISTLFFMLVGSVSWSQTHNIVFEELTTDGALEGKAAIDIVQDNEGFLWFASLDGLYRYDGSKVKVFTYDEEDTSSLADNYVRDLLVDSKGNLWVGAWNNGLNKYDPEREAFVRYTHDPNDPESISQSDVEEIYEDSAGRLWVVTASGGLNLFDPENETFRRFQGTEFFKNDSIWRIIEDKDHQLWVGHRNGVDILDLHTLKMAEWPTPLKELEGKWVTAMHEDRKGDIWFGTWRNGLYRWSKSAQRLTRILDTQGRELLAVKDFFDGPDGRLWVTAQNVLFFDFDTNEMLRYQSALNTAQKIEKTENWPIFQDREGVIWIGSWSGIFKYNPLTNIHDYSYRKLFGDAPFFSDPINFVLEDEEGNLWIIWKEAIGYWDPAQQDLQYYDLKGKLVYKGERYDVGNIHKDRRGFLWLLTHAGPFRFDLQEKELVHISELLGESEMGLFLQVPDIEEDTKGNLWMASMESGLYCYNYYKRTIEHFYPISGDPTSISYNLINDLFLEGDSILWLGIYGTGVDRFDIRTKKVTHHFRHEPGNINSLSQERVISIEEDDHEQLWIGTEAGLNVLDKKTYKVTNLSKSIGLGNGYFSRIKINNEGQVVINHEGALIIMDPQTYTYRRIGRSEGLASLSEGLSSNHQFALVNGNNRIYYVESENNIVSFHLDSIRKNTNVPPVKITGLGYRRMIDAQERQFELYGISRKKSVKLSYQDDLITIDFAALSFSKPTQNQFKYRLLPSNPNWISLGNQSSVNFMNLPPREYTFEVMGSNGDGVWNPEPTSLKIVITPPWWASSWARAIYLISFLAGLVIFVRLRLRSLINRQKILEESVAERTRELAIAKQEAEEANEAKSIFLSTVSHELRTPLTSIIGFTKLNKKSLEDKILPAIDPQNKKALKAAGQLTQNLEVVTSEGKRLTTLINDLLDLAKIEAGKVEWKMEVVNPQEIIEQALSSTAILFKEKKLDLHKDIHPNLSKIKADKDRIIQVIINLMSNAAKFTDKGSVTIAAKQENGNLLVSIKDTGKGIAFEDLPKVFEKFKQVGDNMTDKPQGTGLGLPICKEIIDFHNGEIWVESEEGKGSAFSFAIPLLNNLQTKNKLT